MKQYELLTIIKPNLDADEADKVIDKVADLISGFGGSVSATEKMGRKKLAYDVDNFRDGFYVTQEITIPTDKIVEFKRQLKLTDAILRVMLLELSKVKA